MHRELFHQETVEGMTHIRCVCLQCGARGPAAQRLDYDALLHIRPAMNAWELALRVAWKRHPTHVPCRFLCPDCEGGDDA